MCRLFCNQFTVRAAVIAILIYFALLLVANLINSNMSREDRLTCALAFLPLAAIAGYISSVVYDLNQAVNALPDDEITHDKTTRLTPAGDCSPEHPGSDSLALSISTV